MGNMGTVTSSAVSNRLERAVGDIYELYT